MAGEKEKIRRQPEDSQEVVRRMTVDLWNNRRFVLRFTLAFLLLGFIVAISKPKEYDTTVSLAPEIINNNNNNSALANLSSRLMLQNSAMSNEALSPNLYPEILGSTPFVVDLSDIIVPARQGEMRLSEYISDYTRSPWWSYILAIPGKAVSGIKSLFSGKEQVEAVNPGSGDPYYRLSARQHSIVRNIRSRISVKLDSKSGIAFITVRMQDPVVAAVVADSVLSKLQNHITEYRTEKARRDFEFMGQLFEEAKSDYLTAQQRYAAYVDRNKNVILQTHRAEEEQLRNEVNLAYGIYNQAAQNLSVAKAKIQEITPVYTIVQPATVSERAAAPRKMLIVLAFTFLGFVLAAGWVLFLKDFYRHLKTSEKKIDSCDN